MDLTTLPLFTSDESIRCVVECPAGAPNKLRYDPIHGVFEIGKSLIKGLTYPFDWGFLPSTLGDDGDPLDVMIVHDTPTTPGIVVPAQLIGVLEIVQLPGKKRRKKGERNDRFFAVPSRSGREDALNHVDDLAPRLRQELERFFVDAAQLEDRQLQFLGWRGPKRALALIKEGMKAAAKKRKDASR